MFALKNLINGLAALGTPAPRITTVQRTPEHARNEEEYRVWKDHIVRVLSRLQGHVEYQVGGWDPASFEAFTTVMLMILPKVYAATTFDEFDTYTTHVEEPTDPLQMLVLELVLNYLDHEAQPLN